jgi:hypothetical protein
MVDIMNDKKITVGLQIVLLLLAILCTAQGIGFIFFQGITAKLFLTNAIEPEYMRYLGGARIAIGLMFFLGWQSRFWIVVKPILITGIAYYMVQALLTIVDYTTVGAFPSFSYLVYGVQNSLVAALLIALYNINSKE